MNSLPYIFDMVTISFVCHQKPHSLQRKQIYGNLEIFSNLMAETKDSEMSQICIVSVKFLKDVRDFDRNAANWQ
jgi:hypothetical protein